MKLRGRLQNWAPLYNWKIIECGEKRQNNNNVADSSGVDSCGIQQGP